MPEILYDPTKDLPEPNLPVVYRASRLGVWIVLAASVVFVAIGIYLIAENSNRLIGTADVFRARIPSNLFGWLAALLGVIGAVMTGVTLLRDRPRLELWKEALVQYPRFAAPRAYAWKDIERIEVRNAMSRTTAMGDTSIDSIVLLMKGGREVSFVASDDAEGMRGMMERVSRKAIAGG